MLPPHPKGGTSGWSAADKPSQTIRAMQLGRNASFSMVAAILVGVILILSMWRMSVAENSLVLSDPTLPLDSVWTHQRFRGETLYEATTLDGVAAIRALGNGSASGLFRELKYSLVEHPSLEWQWRVDKLQNTADLRAKDREDFGAAIFLIFGQPSMRNRNVPTLAYVWTASGFAAEAIIDSPYHPTSGRSIVVRSGTDHLRQWMHERRNVIEDFRRAFGRDPPEIVDMVALFTDNDQTGEPVEAYYGTIRALGP